ncbi:MAG: hypothetical protein RLN76_01250 [Phycisphaeraceae bacterium]
MSRPLTTSSTDQPGVREQCTRYLPVVRGLAERAIGMAVDASPHAARARAGEVVRSLVDLLPVARKLLGLEGETGFEVGDGGVTRWTDGLGHHRPAYGYLAGYLMRRAGLVAGEVCAPGGVRAGAEAEIHGLWVRTMGAQWRDGAFGRVGDLRLGGVGEPMFVQGADDSPDEWTYRELLGLHGLVALGRVTGDRGMLERAGRVAVYHVGHTQPDYTTYQPWGLAWFLRWPATVTFGEQQLHDVTTHLAIEGGAGALVPALLLADACLDLEADCGGGSS